MMSVGLVVAMPKTSEYRCKSYVALRDMRAASTKILLGCVWRGLLLWLFCGQTIQQQHTSRSK
jgi:hypothetical protein